MVDNHNNNNPRQRLGRRKFLTLVGGTALGSLAGCSSDGQDGGSGGDGSDGRSTNRNDVPGQVSIGMVAPLDGPFANFGRPGEVAFNWTIDQINQDGGIESLGGAELVGESVNAGDSTDAATTATQDLLSNDEMAAAMGTVISSFTLGATSVAEREQIPWITQSYSDKIVNRGFEFTFKTTPSSMRLTQNQIDNTLTLAEQNDINISRTAILADNTAASEGFRNALKELIPETDIEIVWDEAWTPTLDDVTAIVDQIENTDLDGLWFFAVSLPDIVQLRQETVSRDITVPWLTQGSNITIPEVYNNLGSDVVNGMFTQTGANMMSGQKDLVSSFAEDTGQPYIQEQTASYIGMVRIVAEALEMAGSTDSVAIRDAIAEMEVSDGLVPQTFPVDTVMFNDNGQMADVDGTFVQYQDTGNEEYIQSEIAPFTLAPNAYAQREPIWER